MLVVALAWVEWNLECAAHICFGSLTPFTAEMTLGGIGGPGEWSSLDAAQVTCWSFLLWHSFRGLVQILRERLLDALGALDGCGLGGFGHCLGVRLKVDSERQMERE